VSQNCLIKIELSEPTDAEMTQIQMFRWDESAIQRLSQELSEGRKYLIPDSTALD
jgi:hypothetical protein